MKITDIKTYIVGSGSKSVLKIDRNPKLVILNEWQINKLEAIERNFYIY